jgi:hypothetical protein
MLIKPLIVLTPVYILININKVIIFTSINYIFLKDNKVSLLYNTYFYFSFKIVILNNLSFLTILILIFKSLALLIN